MSHSMCVCVCVSLYFVMFLLIISFAELRLHGNSFELSFIRFRKCCCFFYSLLIRERKSSTYFTLLLSLLTSSSCARNDEEEIGSHNNFCHSKEKKEHRVSDACMYILFSTKIRMRRRITKYIKLKRVFAIHTTFSWYTMSRAIRSISEQPSKQQQYKKNKR